MSIRWVSLRCVQCRKIVRVPSMAIDMRYGFELPFVCQPCKIQEMKEHASPSWG